MDRPEVLAIREGDSKTLHGALFRTACNLDRQFASGMRPYMHAAQYTTGADGLTTGAQFIARHVVQAEGVSYLSFDLIESEEESYPFVEMPSEIRRRVVEECGMMAVKHALEWGVVRNTLQAVHVTDINSEPEHHFGIRHIYTVNGQHINGGAIDGSQGLVCDLPPGKQLSEEEMVGSVLLLDDFVRQQRARQAERFAKVLQALRL